MDTLSLLREAGTQVQRIRLASQKIEEGIIELCTALGQLEMKQVEKSGDLSGLTERQQEIFKLMTHGADIHEISTRLGVKLKTVEAHQNSIRLRFKFATAEELRAFAVQQKNKG